MKRPKNVRGLAKRTGPNVTKVKVKRRLPIGEAKFGLHYYAKTTPEGFMDRIIERLLEPGHLTRFEFTLGGSKKSGRYFLLHGSLFESIVFPSGSASKREVKQILKNHAKKLMQRFPHLKEIQIR